MALIDIRPTAGAATARQLPSAMVALGSVLRASFGATAKARYAATSAAGSDILSADMTALHLRTNVANAFSLSGARFRQGGRDYVVKADGSVQVAPSPATGIGTTVGTMTPAQGEVVLNSWQRGTAPQVTDWRGVAGAPVNGSDSPFSTYAVTFRVPTAPLRPGSMSVLGTMMDGTTFNVTADANGYINSSRIKGRVNYNTGVAVLVGVSPTGAAGQGQADLSFLGIPEVAEAFIDLIQQETLRYNAVAYAYLPIDPSILGMDPVRLPTDGRVPIFRAGGVVVVGHAATTAPANAVNGGTVDMGRTRLSRVRVIGNDGQTINSGYSVDLDAGVLTWTDVSGYSQPVRIEHRIEDMLQVRDAQIDGTLTFTQPLTHVYPLGAYVSSALLFGDMRARVSVVFDQANWDGVTFSDVIVGNPATGTYNHAEHPIVVTNAGAVTERWVLLFTSNTSFRIIGEHVGEVGTGNINSTTAPMNPSTGQPYFTIPEAGWGGGWVPGNIVRENTVGAMAPIWLARTIKQGPAVGEDYAFELLVRGGIDNPL